MHFMLKGHLVAIIVHNPCSGDWHIEMNTEIFELGKT